MKREIRKKNFLDRTPLGHLVFIMLHLGASGCKDEFGSGDLEPIIFPASEVSYYKHVEPLLQQQCAFAGCHLGMNAQMALDLSAPSYHKLRNHRPFLVEPGNGSESFLVKKIDGRFPPRMPLNQPALTSNQIEGIKTWINEGALNN